MSKRWWFEIRLVLPKKDYGEGRDYCPYMYE
jgi:hypothetical protein